MRFLASHYILFKLLSVWLIIGALFFGIYLNYGLPLGIYTAVNFGFGFGWCLSSPNLNRPDVSIFSSFFFTTGVVFLQLLLTVLSEYVNRSSSEKWFLFASSKHQNNSLASKLTTTIQENQNLLIVFYLSIYLFIVGFAFWLNSIDWSVSDAILFAASTITGVGAFSVSAESQSSITLSLLAVYSLLAVVAGGVCLLLLVRYIHSSFFLLDYSAGAAHATAADSTLTAALADVFSADLPVQPDELKLMHRLGIRNKIDSQSISKQEFFLLTALRMGQVDYKYVQAVYDSFDRLEGVQDDKIGHTAIHQALLSSAHEAVKV